MTVQSRQAVYVIGCGGHAKVVVSLLQQLERSVRAIFDDDPNTWGTSLFGVPVQGPVGRLAEMPRLPAVIAVGDNARRRAIAEQLSLDWLTVVHPTAWIDPFARLGSGTVVMAGAVVQADARLGNQTIVNTSASVDHDCVVGDYAHVASGATLAGSVTLEPGVLIGAGACCVPGVRVGAWSVVGAGAAVTSNVPPRAVALGVPARVRVGETHRASNGQTL